LIFFQSSFPSLKSVPELAYSDKLLHFLAYAVLGALFLRAYKTLRVRNKISLLIVLSILSSSLYGISDEIHQHFIPYRSFEYYDILADFLGSIFGVLIYQFAIEKLENRRDKFRDE
jgi:VanZ family protein